MKPHLKYILLKYTYCTAAKVSFLCLSDISGYQDTNHISKQRSSVLREALKIKEEISRQPYPAGLLLQQGHVQLLFEQSVVKVSVTVLGFFFRFVQ